MRTISQATSSVTAQSSGTATGRKRTGQLCRSPTMARRRCRCGARCLVHCRSIGGSREQRCGLSSRCWSGCCRLVGCTQTTRASWKVCRKVSGGARAGSGRMQTFGEGFGTR
eukprot:7170509-Pyramimonas_sp.AAC.1